MFSKSSNNLQEAKNHILLSFTHVYCSQLMKLWTAVSDQTKGLFSHVISESHGNYHMLGTVGRKAQNGSWVVVPHTQVAWRMLSAAACVLLLPQLGFHCQDAPGRQTAGRMCSIYCRGDWQYFRCVFSETDIPYQRWTWQCWANVGLDGLSGLLEP